MSATPVELTEEERRHQVWNSLRLVVIDTETTGSKANVCIVSLAAITIKHAVPTGSWATFINPGVPISKASTHIHGITDDHVRSEPAFDDVADQLINTLTPATDDETVVFVAHKAGYDLGAIKAELDRRPDADGVLRELPDIPVLDTLADEFHALAGIRPKGRSLPAIAEHLGVALTGHHNALSDALACAQVAVNLIGRAIANGHGSFDSIHAAAGGKTTQTHPTSTAIRPTKTTASLSEAHAASHTRTLPANPSEAAWAQWKDDVIRCVLTACPRLTDRLHAAPFTSDTNSRLLALARPLALPDEHGSVRSPVLNTIGHALADNIGRAITPGTEAEQRAQARDLLTRWHKVLSPANPCDDNGLCPGCAKDAECGRDTWWRPLVPALRGQLPSTKAPPTTGSGRPATAKAEQARAGYRTALASVDRWFRPDRTNQVGVLVTGARIHQPSANYAVWTIVEWHLAAGRINEADRLAARAVTHGFYDPRTVNHHLTHLTAARRAGDIKTALHICHTALATRDDSTDVGWLLISAREAHLAGIQERLNVTYTGQVDADGNPIPKRRHQPENPTRTWPLRFARDPNRNMPSTPGNWVRINEAARLLNLTTYDVSKKAQAGELTAEVVNGLAWFDADELLAFQKVASQPPPPPPRLRKAERRPLRKQERRRPPGSTKKPPTPAPDPAPEPAPEPPVRDPGLRKAQPPGHHPGGGGPWTRAELDAAQARLLELLAKRDQADAADKE